MQLSVCRINRHTRRTITKTNGGQRCTRLLPGQSSTIAPDARKTTLAYQYDSLNRITQRTLSGTGISTPETTTYEWDKADRLTSHSTTIGTSTHTTRYSYDEAGRLNARKVQAGTVQDIITQQYGYDSLDRLSQIKYVKAQGTAGEQLIEQIDYEYDANGRRTAKTTLNNNGAGGTETPMTASFDAGNRMTGITLNPNTTNAKNYSLAYDANGNLTSKQNTADAADKTLYTWDADNRLSRIEQGGTNPLTATFSYDAMGRRIQSSITKQGQPTATVQYLYEGAQALGEIRDGKLSHRLLTGLSLDETIARIALTTAGAKDQAASRIFLTDALNSVIAQMSDSDDSSLQTSYAYSPYGASTTVGTDPANNPIQYTSRENDGTGHYYYRARTYDPVLGRFISEDPIGLRGGMNMHGYVGGNPVSFADPEGLQHDARPRRPNFPEWAQPTQPRRNCATADCAAGTSQPTDNCTCVENCKAKLESDPDRPVGAVCTFLAEQMTKSKSLGAVLGALVGEYCKGADKTFTCNAECSEFCRGKTSCNPYPSK